MVLYEMHFEIFDNDHRYVGGMDIVQRTMTAKLAHKRTETFMKLRKRFGFRCIVRTQNETTMIRTREDGYTICTRRIVCA